MKCLLLLLVLLLGTVSPLHLKNDGPKQESLETVTDLSQDLEGSGEQDGELALTEQVIPSEGEECETDGSEDSLEDEETMESDTADLDEDFQCPKEEETVLIPGSPGCKTCHFRLVLTPRQFRYARRICWRCYRSNLVSIHSYNFNSRIQCAVSRVNQCLVWIGARTWRHHRYYWTDRSCWNFSYWVAGQPRCGHGRCVALRKNGGLWQRFPCVRRLPFVCSA